MKINKILEIVEKTLNSKQDSIDELFIFNQEDNSLNRVLEALEKESRKKIPDNIIFITVKDIIDFYESDE
jgi:hypothetical protein